MADTTVPGGIITLEYAKTGLGWKTPTADPLSSKDADLATYIAAATPVIENIVGPVLPRNVTRKFSGGRTAILIPAAATAIISVKEMGNAITEWMFDDTAGILYRGTPVYPLPFYPGNLSIEVTYTVGYTDIPPTLQLAAREMVRHWVQQGMQANRPTFDDAGNSDSQTVPMGFAVPRRVMELCQAFATTPGFA